MQLGSTCPLSYHRKCEYDHAITDYTETIRIDPKDADAYNYRAGCHEQNVDDSEAEADRRKARELTK